MTEEISKSLPITSKLPNDRSPGFPFISLRTAIERLVDFDKSFGRHPTPAEKVGLAWGLKDGSSQAGQILAALKYFGLVDYDGLGASRKAMITEDGRTYLRAQQDDIKKNILKRLALNPKEVAKFWSIWGADRPHDAVCLDTLVIDNKYNEKSAPQFLKVYDDTIAFSGLASCDKNQENLSLDEIEMGDDMNQVILTNSNAINKGLFTPQTMLDSPETVRIGSIKSVCPLDEGDAILIIPKNLSKDSYEDLEYWFKGELRKAQRKSQANGEPSN